MRKRNEPVADHTGKVWPTIKEMLDYYGVGYNNYYNRLRRGWTQEEALTIKAERTGRERCVSKVARDKVGKEKAEKKAKNAEETAKRGRKPKYTAEELEDKERRKAKERAEREVEACIRSRNRAPQHTSGINTWKMARQKQAMAEAEENRHGELARREHQENDARVKAAKKLKQKKGLAGLE